MTYITLSNVTPEVEYEEETSSSYDVTKLRARRFTREHSKLEYHEPYRELIINVHSELMLSRLKHNTGSFGFLPPGAIWISPYRHSLIVAEPPRLHRMSMRFRSAPECECEFGQDEDGDEIVTFQCALCERGYFADSIEVHGGESSGWGTYMLPLPWVYYTFSVTAAYGSGFHLKSVLTSPDAPSDDAVLSSIPVPNVYTNGNVCSGNAQTGHVTKRMGNGTVDYTRPVIQGIANFWSSTFNFDVSTYKDTAVWKFLMSQVSEYWMDNKVMEYWESLPLEELDTLPWGEDFVATLHEYRQGIAEQEKNNNTAGLPDEDLFVRLFTSAASLARFW